MQQQILVTMDEPVEDEPWRPRFTLATLIKSMVILSILTAGLGGLLRESATGGNSTIFFLALVIAMPLAIMIGLSLIESLRKFFDRRGRHK